MLSLQLRRWLSPATIGLFLAAARGKALRGGLLPAAVLAACCAGFAARAQAPASGGGPTGSAERGAQLYKAYRCYACHGFTGETGPGPRLNPPRLDQSAFIAYVRNPATIFRGNVAGAMPPYAGKDVSDQDLADVYAYLESLHSNSPPANSIGLLPRE
ncbi:MAG TPA: c-type cytochrome [Gammaproteobacteria bacterium]|nr:c-type cytochrome [Gammaproteobacteria bacterium]